MIIMKSKVFDLNGNVVEEVDLPPLFSAPLRAETIKRAVLAQQSARRQRYGADPLAGKRSSAHYHGKRRYRFTMMNREMSRIPRIHGKGATMPWRARIAPHAVKGRKAHPPKASKLWEKRINDKERRAAIRSALAASARIELVKQRHRVAESPVIFVNDFESLKRTKDVHSALEKILAEELKRCAVRKERAGRGKTRGRRYAKARGPLIITSANCPAIKAARNIAGVDATSLQNLNAELLAPGAKAGRLVVMSRQAIDAASEKFGDNHA